MSDDLKGQIELLQRTIAEERRSYEQEQAKATMRIRSLEDQLNASNPSVSASPVARKSTTTVVTKRTTTSSSSAAARRSASPNVSSETAAHNATGVSSSSAAADPNQATPPRAGGETAHPSNTPPSAKKFSKSGEKSKASVAAAALPTDTAAQHAWDKFCVTARNEFTVRELSLVSLETLRSLLEHYAIGNPIEAAQIECQWALLQEGRDRADAFTPHDARPSNRAKPFKPLKTSKDFVLPAEDRKPHLSRRALLGNDSTGTDNPHTLLLSRKEVSPGAKGAIFVDCAALSDPNTSPQRSVNPPQGKRALGGPEHQFILGGKPRPRGRSRSHSPNPLPMTSYPTEHKEEKAGGVKRFPQDGGRNSPEQVMRGVRIGYKKPDEVNKINSLKVKIENQYRGSTVVIG